MRIHIALLTLLGVLSFTLAASKPPKENVPQPESKSAETPKTCCSASEKSPESKPATPATLPSTHPGGQADPNVLAILSRLEKAGEQYKTLQADVNYNVVSRMTGDEETRTGTIAFQQAGKDPAAAPAKFRITFETLKLGDQPTMRAQVDYIYDGYWVTEAKHRIKTMQQWQIAEPGKAVDVLKIGKGPFPVPFGQKRDDMLRLLEVTTRDPRTGDPENTDYLRMVPRKEHKDAVNFTRMEMWVDRKTNLPVKIRHRDANKNTTTATFSNIKTQAMFKDSLFKMDKPAGWELNKTPLKKKSQ